MRWYKFFIHLSMPPFIEQISITFKLTRFGLHHVVYYRTMQTTLPALCISLRLWIYILDFTNSLHLFLVSNKHNSIFLICLIRCEIFSRWITRGLLNNFSSFLVSFHIAYMFPFILIIEINYLFSRIDNPQFHYSESSNSLFRIVSS